MKLPFRLARGLAVAVAIVLVHFAIARWFNNMRIPMPDLGPVLVTLLGEPDSDSDVAARSKEEAPPVQVVIETPQQETP